MIDSNAKRWPIDSLGVATVANGPVVLTVHRAAHEIGGNCIEISFAGHRIILDAGTPLEAPTPGNENPIPASLDLSQPVDAVIISHPHQDHYGLLRKLPASWPVWCGAPTESLMRLTMALTGDVIPQNEVRCYESFKPFEVGPFQITPLLTDHSAFDAHMLLIEVGGKRIVYSGDFRRTGRKAALVDRLIKSPPPDIDVLLLEGTTLGRSGSFSTETELEAQFSSLFRETKGRVFVTWSAQNIDRTVSVYRACKRAGRTLVLDLYSVDVLEQLGQHYDSLPQMGWDGLRGVVTSGIMRMYESPDRMNRPTFVERCCKSGHATGAAALEKEPENSVAMLRGSLLRDYERKGVTLTSDDAWVFSMWSGYLDKPEYRSVQTRFEEVGARFTKIHTSGHASRDDLKDFAAGIGARHLVPIHSLEWDQHTEEFDNVMRLQDGQAFQIV